MRKELESRPLVLALIGLVVGLTVAGYPFNLLLLIPLAFAVRTIANRALLCVFVILGGILHKSPPAIDSGETISIVNGVVVSRPHKTEFGSNVCTLATDYGHVLMRFDGEIGLSLMDRVRVKGRLSPRETGAVSRPMTLDAIRLEHLAKGPMLIEWSDAWRDSFNRFAGHALEPSEASLLEAVFFSSPELLGNSTRADIQASGALHMVTAAGLHVLLIALAVQVLMGLLPLPRWIQMVLLASLLALFVAATGFHPSTIRASIFALIFRSAYLFRREPDMLSALSFTGLAMLLFDPSQVEQLGFQLTMVAVVAIAMFKGSEPSKAGKTATARLVQSGKRTFRLAAIATLATVPILAQSQHVVIGETIAAGLLSAFVLPAVLSLAFLLHGFSFISASASGWLLRLLVAPMLSWIQSVTQCFAAAPTLHFEVPYFNGYWLVPLYGCALLIRRPNVRMA